MVARDNRSVGYLIGIGLVPSEFRGSFVEWFAYSALRLGYRIETGLIPSEFRGTSAVRLTAMQFSYLLFICMYCTNVCAGVDTLKKNKLPYNFSTGQNDV